MVLHYHNIESGLTFLNAALKDVKGAKVLKHEAYASASDFKQSHGVKHYLCRCTFVGQHIPKGVRNLMPSEVATDYEVGSVLSRFKKKVDGLRIDGQILRNLGPFSLDLNSFRMIVQPFADYASYNLARLTYDSNGVVRVIFPPRPSPGQSSLNYGNYPEHRLLEDRGEIIERLKSLGCGDHAEIIYASLKSACSAISQRARRSLKENDGLTAHFAYRPSSPANLIFYNLQLTGPMTNLRKNRH